METLPAPVATAAAAVLLGDNAVILAKDGRPLSLADLPPSLRALARANVRAIEDIDRRIEEAEGKIRDLGSRRDLAAKAGLSARGIASSITRAENNIDLLMRLREPFMAGYLEMPTRADGHTLAVEGTEFREWDRYSGSDLSREVPVDVLEDLAAARESGLFDGFVVYRATRQMDPHIVGVVRRPTSWQSSAEFLVAAWR